MGKVCQLTEPFVFSSIWLSGSVYDWNKLVYNLIWDIDLWHAQQLGTGHKSPPLWLVVWGQRNLEVIH